MRYLAGDIRSPEDLAEACEGVDLVFHCAALVEWGQAPRSLVHDINVNGTRNVIAAALGAGVKALVFTSTMDVIYDGRSISQGDETIPYPEKFDLAYAETKARAEQEVIRANGARGKAGVPAHLRDPALRHVRRGGPLPCRLGPENGAPGPPDLPHGER